MKCLPSELMMNGSVIFEFVKVTIVKILRNFPSPLNNIEISKNIINTAF